MNRLITTILLTAFLSAPLAAQPPGEGRGDRGRFGGPGRGGPPTFGLMSALDANNDGKLSKSEIENAVKALAKLDKNKDGKLSNDEIGWPPSFGRGGPGGPPGFGPPGGFPGFGSDNDRPSRPQSDSNFKRPKFFTAAQLQRLDRDKNGKIEKKEIPSAMQSLILGRLDKNKDGMVDAKELAQLKSEEKTKNNKANEKKK